jgi:hypothetical protein
MTTDLAAPVAELRELVAAHGIHLTAKDTERLGLVLERVGDVGLAADAILMVPRPVWLGALIGRNLMVPGS